MTYTTNKTNIILVHGGYRKLKSFQMSEIVYDFTVEFCKAYMSYKSNRTYTRTYDQMVQAARSGRQNIAEGSQASGTSKKTEIKLVSVARASLEELLLDYEDFLRQKGLQRWGKWCQRKMVSGTFSRSSSLPCRCLQSESLDHTFGPFSGTERFALLR